MAEEEIKKELQKVCNDASFMLMLKSTAARCGYRFEGFRKIKVYLLSGTPIEINSPFFVKLKPAGGRRGSRKNRQKVTSHLALEYMGIIERKSPGFISLCAQAAVLCPSFEVAVSFLEEQNIKVGHGLLRRLTYLLAKETMARRSEISLGEKVREKGLRILICIDGGRIRERQKKRGRKRKNQKRSGYTTEWKEPKLFTIHLLDKNGKMDKRYKPVYDGTLEAADGSFKLLESYLRHFNLHDAESITFCADGGSWIWNRIPALAEKLNLTNYNQVLDYTHAKQNLRQIVDIILQNKGITASEYEKTFKKLKDFLWHGDISSIKVYICEKMKNKRNKKTALKKLENYFENQEKFQYSSFNRQNIPIGSGAVESAIRRVLNLRIKGPGLFWKKDNAEKMIFLRSQLLSGRWKLMMNNIRYKKNNNFTINNIGLLKDAA